MTSEYIFFINEQNIGYNINKLYKDDYRFPVEMIVTGKENYQIDSILNKPHGKKEILKFIIKQLVKGPKQYKTLINRLLEKFEWVDVNDSLEILLLSGIIQVVFKNTKPQKSIEWLPKIIQLDSVNGENFNFEKKDYTILLHELNKMIDQILANSKSKIKDKLYKWIRDKEITDDVGNVIARYTSYKKYKSIIVMIIYYIYNEENNKCMPLRLLSCKTWSQPNLLNYYKKDVYELLNITIHKFDSVLLSDLNDELTEPLISITPLEDLQEALNILLNSKTAQEDSFYLFADAAYEFIKDIPEVDEQNEFIIKFNMFKELIINRSFSFSDIQLINDMSSSLKDLKKRLVKLKSIICKYELIVLEKIGQGAFSNVYKVFDPEIETIVACKVLFSNEFFKQIYGKNDEEYLLRFKREVRLLTKELQHANVIKIFKNKLDIMPFWFTMPLADYTLKKWVKDNKNAPEMEKLAVYIDILSGVKYLHQNEKFHRDLAPNNILLFKTEQGFCVNIADFGLAKDLNSTSFHTNLSKRGYGHEYFTDPMQLNSLAGSNELSDIYSLGALLYYIIRGEEPKKKKMQFAKIRCQYIVNKALDKIYRNVGELERDVTDYMHKVMTEK